MKYCTASLLALGAAARSRSLDVAYGGHSTTRSRLLDESCASSSFTIAADADEINGTEFGSRANPIVIEAGCPFTLDFLAKDTSAYLMLEGFSLRDDAGSLPILSYAWDVDRASAATPATFFSSRHWPDFQEGRGTVYDWYYWPLEHEDAITFYEAATLGNATEDYYHCLDRCDYEKAGALSRS